MVTRAKDDPSLEEAVREAMVFWLSQHNSNLPTPPNETLNDPVLLRRWTKMRTLLEGQLDERTVRTVRTAKEVGSRGVVPSVLEQGEDPEGNPRP